MNYAEIRKINVNEHIEKKNNLSYLSWAWAVDQMLLLDQDATWEYGEPEQYGSGTWMVFCTVTMFGKRRTAQLPVMDYKNRAIPDPDAFAMNTAMQRCLAKAISLHGLGLYIYAAEDVPPDAGEVVAEQVIQSEAKPTAEGVELLHKDADFKLWAEEMAGNIETLFKRGDIAGAVAECAEAMAKMEGPEQKTALWSLLPSVVRTAIKKAQKEAA